MGDGFVSIGKGPEGSGPFKGFQESFFGLQVASQP